jgi:hypothetical protein
MRGWVEGEWVMLGIDLSVFELWVSHDNQLD